MTTPRLSVIIPTLNEASGLGALLCALRLEGIELIVVDGGSSDDTLAVARRHADQVLVLERGRALQMNAGAEAASAEHLWFLHADSLLLAPVETYIEAIVCCRGWGFFMVKLSGTQAAFRLIERAMGWRSHLTGVATGDQGIFVARRLFRGQGGFNNQPLMEDVELSKRLRRIERPNVCRLPLQTSSRRWEQAGVLHTVLLMWRLRLLYFFGASPRWLARQYR